MCYHKDIPLTKSCPECQAVVNVKKSVCDCGHCTATNSTSVTIENPRIAAVYKLETFEMCIRCHSRVEPEVTPLGRCTK